MGQLVPKHKSDGRMPQKVDYAAGIALSETRQVETRQKFASSFIEKVDIQGCFATAGLEEL